MIPKFSVVVPAYMAESTLRRCVESILSQTYDNWELILVNDGSIDSTSSICDEYASRDARVVVIHKENGGVSSARNFALDYVSGQWVTFLDSDDEIDDTFLSCFYKGLSTIEPFQLGFFTEYISIYANEKKINHVGDAYVYKKNEFSNFLIKYVDSPILKTVHSVFFLTDIIKNNHVRFDLEIRAGEDNVFVLDYLQYVDAAAVIDGNGYVYYVPYNYSLKYGQKMHELEYKLTRMESRLRYLSEKFNVDLSPSMQLRWRHSLSNIDIMDLYDESIFAKFIELYNAKCGLDYKKDPKCNREARVSSMLIQLSKSDDYVYRKQYYVLKSLLFDRISERKFDASAFPKTTRILLTVASLKNSLLLKILLYAFN